MTRTGYKSIAIPNELYQRLDAIFQQQQRNVTISELVRNALWDFVDLVERQQRFDGGTVS
jgi:metal-responsive CopG/Arc/MetJ family transcriptional regulator